MRYFVIWSCTGERNANKYNAIFYKWWVGQNGNKGRGNGFRSGNIDVALWGVSAEEIGQLMGGN